MSRITTGSSKLYRLTASQALRLIKSNRLTVEQYAQSLLSRFQARDPIVKAWAYFNPDLILQQARKLDQLPSAQRGPLHGVAVAVKDVIYTKGNWHSFFLGIVIIRGKQENKKKKRIG